MAPNAAVGFEPTEPEPASKLAESLRGLARKVERYGTDGNLRLDGLDVVDHEVEVLLVLLDLSAPTLQALVELGFVQTGESALGRILAGRVDVRRLEELARLEAIVSILPLAE